MRRIGPVFVITIIALANLVVGCVHTQQPVRFQGPAALALEVLGRELTALGHEPARMDEPAGILNTRWQDLSFLYGEVEGQEATLFRRYVVIIHRRPADTQLTLRAEVQVCPKGTRPAGQRLPDSCYALGGLIEQHQTELVQLGSELRKALERLRPSPEATPPQAVLVVFDLQAQSVMLPSEAAANLTDLLAAKLTGSGRFQVVPRATIRKAIRDKQHESYKETYAQEFQIELGRAMAANQLLSTQLLPSGAKCLLIGTLYDLKTETARFAATVETGCASWDLPEGLDKLVRKLVDGIR